jgi:hypothetical protein
MRRMFLGAILLTSLGCTPHTAHEPSPSAGKNETLAPVSNSAPNAAEPPIYTDPESACSDNGGKYIGRSLINWVIT